MLQAEYESAEDLCYEQLRDEPDSVFCLTVLGQVAHQRGDIRDAVIMYRKATAVEPELIEPWLLLARALLDRREITDRKSTRLNSSHSQQSRMPSSA